KDKSLSAHAAAGTDKPLVLELLKKWIDFLSGYVDRSCFFFYPDFLDVPVIGDDAFRNQKTDLHFFHMIRRTDNGDKFFSVYFNGSRLFDDDSVFFFDKSAFF